MISICIIVKNEEKNLEKCLLSLGKINQEIVIVDTGSTDRTKEIAYRYTEKVYDFKWCNDFSKARNFSISKSDNDWILVIDADEEIKNIDIKKIVKEIKSNNGKIGRIIRKNNFTRDGEGYIYNEFVNRLFNKNMYKYQGSIHEQLVRIDGSKIESFETSVVLEHIGYSEEEVKGKNKLERNISMLNEALIDNVNDPYIFYQLGKSYYMMKEYIVASDYFFQCLENESDMRLEYIEDAVNTLGYSLINSQNYQDAMMIINLYDNFKYSADYLYLVGIILMNNAKFIEAINIFKEATMIPRCSMVGVNSYLAYYNIGVIYECLNKLDEANIYYKKCGGYKKALERLENIK
ncbi:MAG: glycosyltransferase [Clostridium sp.]